MPGLAGLTDIQQQRGDLLDEAEVIHELAVEENRDLTDDETKAYDDLITKHESLEADEERAAKRERMLSQRRTNRDQLTIDDVQDLDDKKIKIPANVRRVTANNFVGGDSDISPMERAYCFGSFMMAVADRTINTFQFPNQVKFSEERYGPLNVASEGGNAGIWVPDEMSSDIIRFTLRFGIARDVFEVTQMFAETKKIPKQGSDITATWDGEAAGGTDATPTDDSLIELVAKKLRAMAIYSSELSEDAVIDFGNNLVERMGQGMATAEDSAAFNGNSVDGDGHITGLRQKIIDVHDVVDTVGLVLGAGNLFSELTLGNHEVCVARLPDFADSGGQEDDPTTGWICHRFYFFNVMVPLMNALGGTTSEMLANGSRRPVFMGYPVRFSNSYPNTDANSQIVATFGNHKKSGVLGDRRAISVSFTDQATAAGVNTWDTEQIAVKMVQRLDINIHSVGDTTNAGPVIGIISAAS